MFSKSHLSDPFSPLTSIRLAFWFPAASRVASKVATAPPAPALKIAGPDVIDPPQLPLLDHPVRQRQRRAPPVAEPHEALHALARRLGGRIAHRPRIIQRPRQRLLASHVLAILQRGDR